MNKPELAECPVIAAVKNEAQLENALRSECEVVFLLFGDLLNVTELTERVREAGKFPVVHLDLVNGLKSRATLRWTLSQKRPAPAGSFRPGPRWSAVRRSWGCLPSCAYSSLTRWRWKIWRATA